MFADGLGRPHRKIFPAPAQAVLFENGPEAYHGVTPVTGPVERITVTAYYTAPARSSACRRRAMYFPNRTGGVPRELQC